MALPDYQSLMLPLLQFAADGTVHTTSSAITHVGWLFKLGPEDRSQLLPSGRTRVLNNRVHWALTYLRHAGILASAGHGKFRITEEGQALLGEHPTKIDKGLLLARFPAIGEFLGGKAVLSMTEEAATHPAANESSLSPEESVEASYTTLRSELEHALLARLKAGSPDFFERVVLDVLVAMGYGGSRAEAAEHIGGTGDGGIDGIINEDKLGLDKILVQAKRWEGTVGRPVVQGFAGSLDSAHARKGIMITTSSFSTDAREYVKNIEKRIVLMEGTELSRHMVDYAIGVQPKGTFTIYRLDEDYFEEVD